MAGVGSKAGPSGQLCGSRFASRWKSRPAQVSGRRDRVCGFQSVRDAGWGLMVKGSAVFGVPILAQSRGNLDFRDAAAAMALIQRRRSAPSRQFSVHNAWPPRPNLTPGDPPAAGWLCAWLPGRLEHALVALQLDGALRQAQKSRGFCRSDLLICQHRLARLQQDRSVWLGYLDCGHRERWTTHARDSYTRARYPANEKSAGQVAPAGVSTTKPSLNLAPTDCQGARATLEA